jgi:hypothetical protein
MNKSLIIALSSLIALSSCGSYTATGAYTGAQFGHVIGSAIGGIAGGWRGHDMGALIGTVGGAAAGAAIGSAAERAQQNRMERREASRTAGYQNRNGNESQRHDDSGFDAAGRGDDRIVFDETPSPNERSIAASDLARKNPIEIRHARVQDRSGDGVLVRGEECKVSFEIMNNTGETIYNICPLVEDATGNKHVAVSPNLLIESIAPYQGVRYTATILADKRLKDGQIVVRVGVAYRQKEITAQTREFAITTRKK